MCKVKSGSDLKNEQDIRNLIVGLILRQQEQFTAQDIERLTKKFSVGAEYTMSERSTASIIRESLKDLSRYSILQCRNGQYSTKPATQNLSLFSACFATRD